MTNGPNGPWAKKNNVLDKLTRREREVLSLLMEGGHTNKVMAMRMGLCEITIKVFMKGMFRKLGVANRSQAILKTLELGLENLGATRAELMMGLGL